MVWGLDPSWNSMVALLSRQSVIYSRRGIAILFDGDYYGVEFTPRFFDSPVVSLVLLVLALVFIAAGLSAFDVPTAEAQPAAPPLKPAEQATADLHVQLPPTYCTQCGARVPNETSRFCASCGAAMARQPSPASPTPMASDVSSRTPESDAVLVAPTEVPRSAPASGNVAADPARQDPTLHPSQPPEFAAVAPTGEPPLLASSGISGRHYAVPIGVFVVVAAVVLGAWFLINEPRIPTLRCPETHTSEEELQQDTVNWITEYRRRFPNDTDTQMLTARFAALRDHQCNKTVENIVGR